MADAYKVLRDTSLPRPVHRAVTVEGVAIEEVTGQIYGAGDYVYEEELSETTRERVENGDLDDLLEEASREEADQARASADKGLFIPEHEAERYSLLDAGHRVIEKDQVLELRAAGADAAKEYLEASRAGGDDNPQITEQESFVQVGDLTAAANEGEPVLPGEGKQDAVSDYEVAHAPSSSDSGVEMPPGLPVGPTLAKAEGADANEVDEAVEKSAKKPARRAKPGSSSGGSSSSSSSSGGSSSSGSSSS